MVGSPTWFLAAGLSLASLIAVGVTIIHPEREGFLTEGEYPVTASSHALSHPLHQAIQQGSLTEVVSLLRQGADPNHPQNGLTALHLATQVGNPTIMQVVMAAGADLEARDPDGKTPLVYSLHHSDPDGMEILLDQGADPNTQDNNLWTPLEHAAWLRRTEQVAILLNAGVDVNARDACGRSSLHYAVWVNDWEIVRQLLAAGADVNARDRCCASVLHWAAKAGNPEMVGYLIAAGADIHANGSQGSVMDWATPEVVPILRSAQTLAQASY
ncbi:MAG: ankyrin repeat domain-containing protein [Cyanobacteriota bacterium]|nr:ankyrin repeat domain-containing protein [Cyanobacteriota bacterium]